METNITIPYEDYNELLKKAYLFESIMLDLDYSIQQARLNYRGDDLELGGFDLNDMVKKYCRSRYNTKIRELNKDRKEGDE